jgi:phage/plasmid-like protein (TIGR03299 family)
MAHNVESMMYAGETPWHGLGKAVPREVTSEQVDELAGLNWRVEKKTIQVAGGRGVPGYKAVVRSSDQKVLGIVSDIYNPIQHETMRLVCDAIVGEGGAHYHTAGSLNGGEDVWYLLKLPTELRLGADVTEDFLLATTNHAAKRKFRVLPTKIRVVCQNTLNIALGRANADGVAISHFGNPESRIKEATRVLKATADYSVAFNSVAERLYAYQYKAEQLRQLSAALFPAKPVEGEEGDEPEVHWLTQRNREKVEELFDGGKGHQQIAGTAWAALNAVAEFTDWFRGKDENRLASAWMGDGRKMKQKAFAIIRAQVDGTYRPDRALAA